MVRNFPPTRRADLAYETIAPESYTEGLTYALRLGNPGVAARLDFRAR